MPLRRLMVAYSVWLAVLTALTVFCARVVPVEGAAVALAGFTGSAAIGYGVGRYQPTRRRPWYCLGSALFLSTLAQILFRLLPGPIGTFHAASPAVYVVIVAMYALMIAGIIGLARPTPHDLSAVVDVVILLLGTGLLAGILVAVPYALEPQLPGIQAAARVVFVLADVVILAAVVHFATSARWNASTALLVAGVIAFLAFDGLLRLELIRGAVRPGGVLDVLWVLFTWLWGLSALVPAMKSVGDQGTGARRSIPLRLGLLIGASALPFTLLLLATYQPGTPWYEPLVATVSALMLALVLAQLAGVAIRLRNQVAGEQALSRAVAEIAPAVDVRAVVAALEENVPLLGTGRVTDSVLVRVEYQSDNAGPAPPEDVPKTVPPGHLTLAYPLCESDGARDGQLVFYLQASRAALNRLRPGLDVLTSQACLVLERIRLSRELLRSTTEEYVKAVAETSGDVILVVDDADRITISSPSADSIFGTPNLVGARLPDLVDEAARSAVTDLLRRARTRQSPLPGRVVSTAGRTREAVTPPPNVRVGPPDGVNMAAWTMRRSDGNEAQFEVACRQITSSDPSVRGLLVDLRDVTEQRRLERDLTERASRDPLTGLVSGLVVRERVRQRIAANRDLLICMIVLDLKDFKLINNQYGHEVGDEVLKTIASRISAALPPGGLAGRVAGDRFAVICEVAAPGSADGIAHRLLDAISEPVEVEHAVVTCNANAGVATTANADTSPELTRQAELALLIARDEGRGRCHHYKPDSRSAAMERLEMRAALEHALDEQALVLHYQPVVDLGTGQVAGFEALLRWQHPTFGLLSPTAFIDVAEESRLIIPIGDWVLETAMQAARRWQEVAPDAPPFVAVNVTPMQLESSGFCEGLQSRLDAAGIEASRLDLELTESTLVSEDTIWAELQQLRDFGVRIAIDDFGTGYSALSYLGRIPVDRVKLDRQFVASMAGSRTQRDLVEGIVKLTRILKLDVIAEGVETAEERDLAAEVGCRFGQGYLFARPMPADESVAWLATTREGRTGRNDAAHAMSAHPQRPLRLG